MFGQQDKQKIIKAFDKVTYYSDSTIKCAYFIKGNKYNGYAIEFDTLGEAKAIGQYWKGKKHSYWIYPNNLCDHYTNGIINLELAPTCSTGQPNDFSKLYSSILNGITK
jgi:hypothetical protein